MCGVLNMALFGTRGAGHNFDLTVIQVMSEIGCVQSFF